MSTTAPGLAPMPESVLVVENDTDVSEYFRSELADAGIPIRVATSVKTAWEQVHTLLDQNVTQLVILLDLMLERQDPSEGLQFLADLNRLPAFAEEKVSVVVLTGDSNPKTRSDVISYGAREFYSKGGDPAVVLSELLAYVGRQVRVDTTLLEILDVDETKREMEVLYRGPDARTIRCTLDLQFAPREARIPGGSFWFDTYKRFQDGMMRYETVGRPVDEDKDRKALNQVLGV